MYHVYILHILHIYHHHFKVFLSAHSYICDGSHRCFLVNDVALSQKKKKTEKWPRCCSTVLIWLNNVLLYHNVNFHIADTIAPSQSYCSWLHCV